MKFIFSFLLTFFSVVSFAQLPNGFVYVKDVIPNIQIELRYFGSNNFVGVTVDGYNENCAILTIEAAQALKDVQLKLLKKNLSIKIYDAYRPQRSVNHFVRWAKAAHDTLTKSIFYPDVKKKNLFNKGYISSKSRHSSGSTLDITIYNIKTGKVLDMGSPYDFFGSASWVLNSNLSAKQLENRALLQTIMIENGFRNYDKEWWHFTLRNEPYRNKYFDFLVE